jgi:hypothetical protein
MSRAKTRQRVIHLELFRCCSDMEVLGAAMGALAICVGPMTSGRNARTTSTNSMKIRQQVTHETTGDWTNAATAGRILRGRRSDSVGHGRSAIKRAAVFSGSRHVNGPPDNASICEANVRIAASEGNRANFSASSHGSMFIRASAESTLTIPVLSSPNGANRNPSNSDRSPETE